MPKEVRAASWQKSMLAMQAVRFGGGVLDRTGTENRTAMVGPPIRRLRSLRTPQTATTAAVGEKRSRERERETQRMLYLTLKDDPFSEQDYDENDLLEVCSCVPTASQPSPLLLCCRNEFGFPQQISTRTSNLMRQPVRAGATSMTHKAHA